MTKHLIPAGWGDVLGRTLMTAVAAFAALNLKEYLDAGFDVPACALDASWIAGAAFVLNGLLMSVAKPAHREGGKKALSYG